MSSKFLEYQYGIDALTVFSSLKQDPVISGLYRLFDVLAKAGPAAGSTGGAAGDAGSTSPAAGSTGGADPAVGLYSAVPTALYPHGSDLSEYIRGLVLADDNFYVRAVAAGRPLSEEIQTAARRELNFLQDLAAVSSREVREAIDYDGYLPTWTTSKVYLITDFMSKLEQIPVTGFGDFAKYQFFRLAGGEITPVPHPDAQPLEQLFGYERERALVIRNTEALVNGTGASNMLLYGDAGIRSTSHKSSVGFGPHLRL